MHPFPTNSDADAIEALNRDCFCVSLDDAALRRELEAQLGSRMRIAPSSRPLGHQSRPCLRD